MVKESEERTARGTASLNAALQMAPSMGPATSRTVASRTQQTAGVSADLGAALGIDMSGFQGQFATDTEPSLYMGRDMGIVPRSQAFNDFYSWDANKLRNFQERAFRAGMYGSADREDIRFGDHDDATAGVWESLVNRSVGFFSAGKKITPSDALLQAQKANPYDPEADEKKKQKPVINLANGDDLLEVFRAGAKKVLGRGIDDDTLNSWIKQFHADQTRQQSALQTMGLEGGVVEAPPTAKAFAATQARAVDPLRADARKAVGKFDMLIKMLGEGGVMNATMPTGES